MLDLELLYNVSSKYGINMIVEDEYDYYRNYRQEFLQQFHFVLEI